MVVILSSAADLSIEVDASEKIESPENCSISKNIESVHYLKCPHFNMTIDTDDRSGQCGNEYYEYRSSVKCSSSLLPYKYLSR